MNNQNNLESLVDELTTELAHNLTDTIKSLSNVIDITERFYETSHSRTVADLSKKTAIALGINAEDVFQIETAGLLHDIGKIGFRDTALFKSTKDMTSRELNQYKLHPSIGREILSNIKQFSEISLIVYQHHEKYDGTGFPEKKSKDSIHIGARIISVADSYHNFMFKNFRTVKQSDFSSTMNTQEYINSTQPKFEYIVDHLNDNKSSKFDPRVVNAFISVIESERKKIAGYVVKKIHVSNVSPGMIIAENYYNKNGLLLAHKGEIVTNDSKKILIRCADSNEIPQKLLMLTDDNQL